jgi:hypothetical protein
MSPKEKALQELQNKSEPFMIRIKIKSEKLDPEKFKLKKNGKDVDMTPPKIEKAMNKAKKFMEIA